MLHKRTLHPLVASFVALLVLPATARAATPPPLRVAHAAVASDHPDASAAGLALLRAGGNAVDAACATALALGVANPHASGIGGGGFALVWLAKPKKLHVLDFRERAPAASKPELFFRAGKVDPELSRRGGLAVAVPGEVRGLAALVDRFGRRPFAACVAPAERLATRGFAATPRLALASATSTAPEAPHAEATAALLGRVFARDFAKAGPIQPGERLRRPELGATLRTLRTRGPDAFYRGAIATEIVKAVTAAGGVLTREDLAAYQVVDRTPIETSYRGRRVFSMPPPSSGGIVIAEALGILTHEIPDPTKVARRSSTYLHVLAEALKHGFADRAGLLGDTDFVKVPLERLLDAGYHRTLAGRIEDARVLPPEQYGLGGGKPPVADGGTAHLSVVDAEGNAVALTTTINTWFGAHVIAGRTGIVLNNEMDDFSLAPGTPNAFGLEGTTQNAVAPGKRPLSSMSPTIVLEGDRVKLVIGGAGGPTIISGVLQVMLDVLDGQLDAQAASASPRLHHQWRPDELQLEPEVAEDVVEALRRRGHKTATRPSLALVNLIVRTAAGLEAAAEFRSGGAPAGY